jgi:uncharacterized protein
MRWRDLRRSTNVKDMRGRGGGGGGGLKLGLGGLVVMAAAYFLGVDPRLVMGLLDAGGGGGPGATTIESSQPTDEGGDFATAILASTEDVWGQLFMQSGAQYPPPSLVLFDQPTGTACGTADVAVGPFYCPGDQGVYISLGFFQELATRFGGPDDAGQGDNFSRAYVLAHEVGHHVQTVTGISDRIRTSQARGSQEQKNAMQVRMELQADCFAGVWAHYARDRLTEQDVRDALTAAAAVGDDTIQKKMQGYVEPESFTHGTAEQRQRWFTRGFEGGQVSNCDTLEASSL